MIILTEEFFTHLKEQQEQLDNYIRESKEITLEDWNSMLFDIKHTIALDVEKHEFINNCYDSWKYWKSKPVNKQLILEEAVDVLHFIHLLDNKTTNDDISKKVKFINDVIESIEESKKKEYDGAINNDEKLHMVMGFLMSRELYSIYAALLSILNSYGFTLDDIRLAYDEKNKENYERQNKNY